ncbi:cobalt-precorrin 5A hydrolase [Clostridium tarantellae]|uniref:Cobalt-precorrin 5A hydrolase n=1 Tax=Clostridium tarantellae TaxID=39493 RepID=A0A6I1MJ19_9CLOT|nr:cobalt-precorrin 5A hydrolase [Clostridium tarantellae]MPQ42924.1 cobalt-precorrin 5A hydrolase [Clostridium tarantellae]
MIAIVSVTLKGNFLARILKENLKSHIYCKSEIKSFKLVELTRELFEKYKSIIFISSTGIAVRAIAPYLRGKDKDPAIVVVDVCNNYTISLLSGHIGGANKLTLQVAKILNNTPVITTATDGLGIIAPDVIACDNNLEIEDLKKAKYISSLLVNNSIVYFKDDKDLIACPNGYKLTNKVKENMVWITNKKSNNSYNNDKILKLIRKDIILGIGCRKNMDSEKLYNFVLSTINENNIDLKSIKSIVSVEIKKDEKAIKDLSDRLNCEFKTFSIDNILKVQHNFEGSSFVEKTIGVKAVCEPCVFLAGGKIIIPKIKFQGITLAIGQLEGV